jgi:hypothetical protein
MIDREEAIRLIASYPGPVDKSVVRRLLTQMPNAESTQTNAELTQKCVEPTQKCLVAMKFTDEDAARIAERIAREPLQILPKENLQPNLQPTCNWISVTERLPEDDREVLITYADNDDGSPAGVDITTYGTFTFGSQPVKDFDGKPILKWRPPFPYFASNYHVTAWAELPKAYEGGEQDG